MKFYILDGSGYLYRSYYALPPLTDSDGHNVHVLYGFLRMLFKLYQDKPDYFFIAWDSPVKTLRHEQFEQYKANRPKMPDDFRWQVTKTKELVEQLHVNSIQVPGYEADDIIATIAQKYKDNKDIQINIVSGDKDLKQLLTDNIVFRDPMKGEIIDTQKFTTEWGFAPLAIVDYLSLVGDSSDNIAGVKGIGQKTASDLIQKYGDLDSIYLHLDELSAGVREKLFTQKEEAYRSKSLIQLMSVPGLENSSLEGFKLHVDFDNLKKVLVEQYRFSSFTKQLDDLKNKFLGPSQGSLFG